MTAGSGSSILKDSKAATREAIEKARPSLHGGTATYGFVFASPDYDFPTIMKTAHGMDPNCTFVGCTTAGEFIGQEIVGGGIVTLLLNDTDSIISGSFATEITSSPQAAGATLCDNYDARQNKAAASRLAHGSSILLIDGLAGVGEIVIEEMRSKTRIFQQVAGGAAGDNGAFDTTYVGLNDLAKSNAAAALHVFSRKPWGFGLGHGLTAATSSMVVTRAEGNIIHEINGRPAFDSYLEFARMRNFSLDASNASAFMMTHELGVLMLGELRSARAPLSLLDNGALACAAGVPTGTSLCIVDGDANSMSTAAREAAIAAKKGLDNAPAAAVLVFDCVCRHAIMGDAFSQELAEIQSVFPDTPIAGFMTYGEIARIRGRMDPWHNTTVVVVAIPA